MFYDNKTRRLQTYVLMSWIRIDFYGSRLMACLGGLQAAPDSIKHLHSTFFLPNTPAPKTLDPPNPWSSSRGTLQSLVSYSLVELGGNYPPLPPITQHTGSSISPPPRCPLSRLDSPVRPRRRRLQVWCSPTRRPGPRPRRRRLPRSISSSLCGGPRSRPRRCRRPVWSSPTRGSIHRFHDEEEVALGVQRGEVE
jgi:hypothetical protein